MGLGPGLTVEILGEISQHSSLCLCLLFGVSGRNRVISLTKKNV